MSGNYHATVAIRAIDLPPFETGSPGSDDVDVGRGQTITLPPGSYRDLDVDRDGTVIFVGGLYAFREIDVKQRGRLLFGGRARLTVDASVHIRRTDGETSLFVEEASTTSATRSLLELTNNGPVRFDLTDTSGTSDNCRFVNLSGQFQMTRAGTSFAELAERLARLEESVARLAADAQ